MQRLSAAKACYLSESTEDMPKPSDLVNLLDQVEHYCIETFFYVVECRTDHQIFK